ncbi:ABC transporter substrate-binding protein [Actinomadura miaoliensis]|uniref:Extracellular solute-binding protein n=1 Tax=Actinomadura miaoliensis TaxID=430685 RepID=A0ABP7WHV2_9ACTN
MHGTRRAGLRRTLAAALAAALCAALLAACSGTGRGDGRTITVWSLENVTERARITRGILERFTRDTGIRTRLVTVDEGRLSQMIMAAAAAGRLPDVIGAVPLASVRQMAAGELVDTAAAGRVVDRLGAGTFNRRALEFTRDGGRQLAVPSDSWTQLIVYRRDLFQRAGLAPPDSYQNLLTAARTLHRPGLNGISLANDPSDPFTQQSFEDLALAGGCHLTGRDGDVALDTPPCRAAFSLYGELSGRFSAQGAQTVDSTRATYFAGRSAMIIWSSMLLDELAGLREDVLPSCPECRADPRFLARNSGVVTAISGPGGSAQYGEVTSWVITRTAHTASSERFVRYMFDEGYADWFGMAPEGKVPARNGTPSDPRRFQRQWEAAKAQGTAPLSQIYPKETIDQVRYGVDRMQRWGVLQNQGVLVGAMMGELPVPKVLAALASGQTDAAGAARQADGDVAEIRSSLE